MFDWVAMAGALHIFASSVQSWIWIVPGLFIGLVFSAVPGVTISMAMAIVLPLSMYMDFFPAIVFLTSVYTGGVFGGSVPAILMNIPGSPSSYATTFDGYPMTLKGQHNEALGIALFSSTLCCMLGYLFLFFMVEPIANLVVRIGPPELFAVALWGMALLGSIGGKSVTKGILAACIGVLFGTVGMNTAGYVRGTMGSPYLLNGISPIPAMIGLLAAGQLLTLAVRDYIVEEGSPREVSFRRILVGCLMVFKYPGVLLRGTVIGIVLGIVPGVGSAIANLISYAETRRTSKDANTFGTGNPKGVIGAEAAVASGEGGSMATMLALGIPGHGAVAVLLAAFLMHNVVPGPSLITQHRDMVYAIIMSNLLQSVVLLGVGLVFIYLASGIVRLRTRYIVPMVLVLATMGTYSIDGTIGGPVTLFVFSVIGVFLVRYHYPVSAVVVGILLGRTLETEGIRSFQMSGGRLSFFLHQPIALGMLLLMVVTVARMAWRKGHPSAAAQVSISAAKS